jgi:hypothetical protein
MKEIIEYYIPLIQDITTLKNTNNISSFYGMSEKDVYECFKYFMVNYKIYKIDEVKITSSKNNYTITVYNDKHKIQHSITTVYKNGKIYISVKSANNYKFYMYSSEDKAVYDLANEYKRDFKLLQYYKQTYENKLKKVNKLEKVLGDYPEYMI